MASRSWPAGVARDRAVWPTSVGLLAGYGVMAPVTTLAVVIGATRRPAVAIGLLAAATLMLAARTTAAGDRQGAVVISLASARADHRPRRPEGAADVRNSRPPWVASQWVQQPGTKLATQRRRNGPGHG